jgi:hypothetical protein
MKVRLQFREARRIKGTKQEQRNRSPLLEVERLRWTKSKDEEAEAYFCQVRFLCRLARSCLRRLCLLIFALRRFFSEPIQS